MSADYRRANWRKSSFSNGNGGTCVELAHLGRLAAIRDSKNPDGPVLLLAPDALAVFVARAGDRAS
ncbi:uncharacterized protein DUF397 [Labedaea rhizosphaerae]|uniref:Uncharacterized protein DUF397 n=2 Tax=Labedaea rhizosphaerae TaxID=598644 RepID=A0A4R6S410_LABRH|nr:DUF397 domain-containing protein [Labedaea rhizosphaerae]TDP94033.1 uncharacterized protein DUF397 [Labedaea rhizosphaerae]